MKEIELNYELRKTSFVMKGMAAVMATYGGPEWLQHAKELEDAADMVMSWSLERKE